MSKLGLQSLRKNSPELVIHPLILKVLAYGLVHLTRKLLEGTQGPGPVYLHPSPNIWPRKRADESMEEP